MGAASRAQALEAEVTRLRGVAQEADSLRSTAAVLEGSAASDAAARDRLQGELSSAIADAALYQDEAVMLKAQVARVQKQVCFASITYIRAALKKFTMKKNVHYTRTCCEWNADLSSLITDADWLQIRIQNFKHRCSF
jgi:hypothetical protein